MKKVFTILISILLVALLIFCIHSLIKKVDVPEKPPIDAPDITHNQPIFDDPNTPEDESKNNQEADPSQVFTEIGFFNGRNDTHSIELVVGSDTPMTLSYRLSPEDAEKFSSYNLIKKRGLYDE